MHGVWNYICVSGIIRVRLCGTNCVIYFLVCSWSSPVDFWMYSVCNTLFLPNRYSRKKSGGTFHLSVHSLININQTRDSQLTCCIIALCVKTNKYLNLPKNHSAKFQQSSWYPIYLKINNSNQRLHEVEIKIQKTESIFIIYFEKIFMIF
jgi:hypothetical protein